jgi:hypothetical protein
MMATSSSNRLLQSQVDHVVLQPRLPGKREENLVDIDNALNDRLLEGARSMQGLTSPHAYALWDTTRCILLASKSLNAGGTLDKRRLLQELRSLQRGITLILHITEQNAGLLIRRHYE